MSDSLSPRDAARLAADSGAADAAGVLQPRQVALVHRRGWLKRLAPRDSGGAEWPLPRMVRLEEALARTDGSAAWVVTLCAGAGWFAGFLDPALARQIITTKRVCLAGSGEVGGTAQPERGGWRLDGEWRHATGAPLATHFTLNASIDDAGTTRAFVVPAREVEIVPTWNAMGMRATASHAYRIRGAWVPANHAFRIEADAATATGPLYRFAFMPLAYVTLAANVCGMAWHFVQLARASAPAPAEEHAARLDALRATFYASLDAAWAKVDAGGTLDAHDAARLEHDSLDWVQAARDAVNALYPLCGLRAADAGADINRVWRDLQTASQHALLRPRLNPSAAPARL